MLCSRRWAPALLLALSLSPSAAGADEWVVDDTGQCVRNWTPRSLARGPIAMTNGILLPFRSLAGGFTDGVVGAVMSPIGFFVGLGEGVIWLTTGVFELLSGGAVGLAPEGVVTDVLFAPVPQFPLGARDLEEYRVELCERPEQSDLAAVLRPARRLPAPF